MDTIIWFEQSRISDVPRVGGKAASLGELLSIGIDVPGGFTVPASVYTWFMESTGLDVTIGEILSGLDVNDTADLAHRAQEIRQLITSANMPPRVQQSIIDSYIQLTEDTDGYVAVRSSATAEDLPDDSFAGQQSTYLNVFGPEAVVRKVQECWASLFEDRAIFYRAERGYDHMSVGLAAVVQRMVNAQQAGVMFTVNSMNGTPEIEISAGHGLGELVVGGDITPDAYFIPKDELEVYLQTSDGKRATVMPQIRRELGHQAEMLVRSDTSDDGEFNNRVPVPEDLRGQPVLTDAQILELAAIGLRIERHYGKPMDTEWAIDPNDRILMTQARPITVNKQPQDEDEPITEIEPAELLLEGQPASPGVTAGRVIILQGPHQNHLVQEGDVLVARMTTPDFMPAMKRTAAIVTVDGGRLCHAAIVSRELNTPCIVGAANALEVLAGGELITVDGSHGHVFKGKAQTRLAWNERRVQRNKALMAQMTGVRTKTKVYAILADPAQAAEVAAMGVDGVGIVRLEFLLNRIGEHPASFIARGAADEYIQALVDGIEAFLVAFGPDRRVVLRFGDFKTNEYRNLVGSSDFETFEENPMIGLRGVARYLQRPKEFALEVEAVRRLRQMYPNLTVMLPFVRTGEELSAVIDLLKQGGVEGDIWMMAEVPSNVLLLEEFIAAGIHHGLTGISIGSNDLTQLVFGIDRDNPALTKVADECHPILRAALRRIIQTSNRYGITVGICGQAPSDFPELARQLVEWGVTSMSVTPDAYPRTRQLVANIEKTRSDIRPDDSTD